MKIKLDQGEERFPLAFQNYPLTSLFLDLYQKVNHATCFFIQQLVTNRADNHKFKD